MTGDRQADQAAVVTIEAVTAAAVGAAEIAAMAAVGIAAVAAREAAADREIPGPDRWCKQVLIQSVSNKKNGRWIEVHRPNHL